MKRKVVVVLILIVLFIFGGCGIRDNTHTTEFYKIYVFENTATVLELTDKGKEQEALIIPSEFNGSPVTELGMAFIARKAKFQSENLKKVYIPQTVVNIKSFMFTTCENLEEMYINSDNFKQSLKGGPSGLGVGYTQVEIKKTKFFIPNLYYESIKEEIEESYKHMANPANISFNYNYEDSPNEGYYFIDNISDTGKITKPDNPKRQGYAFVSWYTEPEFKNEWNFETDEVIVEKDEEGNPIYSETILYARWAKID